MSQKKRIHDLAKEFGMPAAELVKKLQDRGFPVKGSMTTIDQFQELQIRGMFEAEGLVKETGADTSASAVTSGVIVRKKKKLTPTTSDVELERVAPEPERRPEPAAATPAPVAHVELHEPVETPPAPFEIALDAPPTPIEFHQPEPELEVAADAHFEPVQVSQAEIASPAEAPVASLHESTSAPAAPLIEEEVAPFAGSGTGSGIIQPAPTRRLGKVVGFIDLSKIKSNVAKKPESRRLRSKDDVAPNVQPTLGHDKKRALVRGDRGARGTLSAGQLREREAGRFLRRRGPTPAGAPGPGGPRPSRGMRTETGASPYSGNKLKIDLPITVKKLADKLSVKTNELITMAIQRLGMDLFKVNINSLLDEDSAVLLAHEFGVELEVAREIEAEQALIGEIQKKRKGIEDDSLVLRPPTVAFLGHVDHGKTTLIDTIRQSRVAAGEAGGITQHVGAYQVETQKGHKLTILDTPGHAAFTAMRSRGARAVDIVVLVVAADDGPMPSTEEALAHARAAKVPVVVALTKMDKAEANPQRAMEALARLELNPEEWGGHTAFIKVSAVKNQGIQELLERVFLESEVLELKSHPKGPAQGVVLEAEVSEGKGIVAHLLVQDGTLNRGDVILAGEGYGKVRSMHDDRNKSVEFAPPSMPVEVSGLSALPGIGERFYVIDDLAKAKEVAEERERKNRAMSLTERRSVSAETLLKVVADQSKHMINLVVRADVQGSAEVLKSSLAELTHPEVEVKVLFAGVGAVTESDVLLGSSSTATIIAFNVGVNDKARVAADRLGLEIRHYEVIYELLDEIRAMMEGSLSPQVSEEITGHAEVRALFKSSKVGNIAGSHVIDGALTRDSKIRVKRGNAVVFTGLLASLRREKDDAKEVREGFDCGIVVKDYDAIQVGDVVEAYKIVKTRRTLGDRAKA
ncbi:MAG: translation initiation factor IF-2 [Planctomycetota bacterium]